MPCPKCSRPVVIGTDSVPVEEAPKVSIACDKCELMIEVAAEFRGRKKCPRCKQMILVGVTEEELDPNKSRTKLKKHRWEIAVVAAAVLLVIIFTVSRKVATSAWEREHEVQIITWYGDAEEALDNGNKMECYDLHKKILDLVDERRINDSRLQEMVAAARRTAEELQAAIAPELKDREAKRVAAFVAEKEDIEYAMRERQPVNFSAIDGMAQTAGEKQIVAELKNKLTAQKAADRQAALDAIKQKEREEKEAKNNVDGWIEKLEKRDSKLGAKYE